MLHQRFANGPLGRRRHLALALGLALGLGISGTITAHAGSVDQTRLKPDALLTLSSISGQSSLDRTATPASAGASTDTLAPTAVIPVYNCDDSGNGSLRTAISLADDGDTIDLSGLDCQISLESSIVTSVDNLTLKGPGDPMQKYVSVSGGNNDRVIRHNGTGTLTLDGLKIGFGRIASNEAPLEGGCIRSAGNVTLTNYAMVKYCDVISNTGKVSGGAIYSAGNTRVANGAVVTGGLAQSTSGDVAGGGIFAGGSALLSGGIVTNNEAITDTGNSALGGGVYASGMNAKYGIISDNLTRSNSHSSIYTETVAGGGAFITGSTIMERSSVYSNTSRAAAGLALGSAGSGITSISHSTIANNTAVGSKAKYGSGGMWLGNDSIINNSTISGNTEQNDAGVKYGAGLKMKTGASLSMSSTIVAGNLFVGQSSSLASDIVAKESSPLTISGDHNLVTYVENVTLPADTLEGVNAKLGPLQDNGGLTPTMVPLPGSPAIDKGKANNATWDQRGTGFRRTIGTAPDIGAVEVGGDRIFANGFESP